MVADDLESVRSKATVNALKETETMAFCEMFVEGGFRRPLIAFDALRVEGVCVGVDVVQECPEGVEGSLANCRKEKNYKFG